MCSPFRAHVYAPKGRGGNPYMIIVTLILHYRGAFKPLVKASKREREAAMSISKSMSISLSI